MSNTIDQKVVEMRFDNRQFESGAAESMSTIDKLKQRLKFDGATKGLENVNSAANKLDFKKIENTACEAGFRIQDVWTKTASIFEHQIADKIVNTSKKMVSALTIDPIKTGFQEYETQMNAVQTILANTQSKGSTLDDVNNALDLLNTYADKTIYNFTEMTRNIGTFTAAGVDLQTSVDSIQGIANLAAVSGSTSQQASTAMYQLSQALAAGRVSLMDWNSVVNAGMGGQLFQDALIRTSELLGTGAKAAIDMHGSFRESLTKGQWLTTDVLTETLKQISGAYTESELIAQGFTAAQAKEISKLAQTATDAATKVKTFSQLWDVMKESAQSGWAQTWKIIVGDFEQAKELLTPLADFFTGVIGKMSDARNNLLKSALGRTFSDLLDKVKGATAPLDKAADAVDKVSGALKDYSTIVDEVIRGEWGNAPTRWQDLTKAGYDWAHVQNLVNEKLGDSTRHATDYTEAQNGVNEAQKDGAKSQSALSKSDAEYIALLAEMSDAQLKQMGYTQEQIDALRELERQAEKTGIPLEEFIKNIDKIDGRFLLFNSFKNIGQSIIKVIKTIKEAFTSIFDLPSTEEAASTLYDLIAGFHKFTKQLIMNKETAADLKSTFRGVFAALDIILTVVGGPIKIAFKLLFKILKACNIDILEFTGSIGEAIVSFRDWIDSVLDFEKIFKAIPKYVSKAVDAFQNWIKKLKKSDNIPLQIVKDLGAGFSKAISYIGRSIVNFADYVLEKIEDLFGIELPSASEYAEVGKNMIDGLVGGLKDGAIKVFNFMINLGKSILEKIKGVLGIHSPSREFFAIGGDIIKGLFNGISEGASLVWNLVKTVGEKIIDIVKNLDIGTIITAVLTIGGVIGFLRISKFLGSVIGPLEGISDTLRSFTTKLKADSLKSIAIAIAILAAAVALLALLPYGKVWSSVGAIAALGGVLALLSVALGKWGPKESKDFMVFAGSIVVLSVALLIMAKAINTIADLKFSQAAIAITSLVLCLGTLLGVIMIMNKFSTPRRMAEIGRASLAFVGMAIAIGLLAYVCKTISTSEWINNFEFSQDNPVIKALEVMGIIALGLAVFVRIAGPAINKFTGAILKFAIAMQLILFVSKQCSKIDYTEEEWNRVIVSMVGLLTIVGILALIGRGTSKVVGQGATIVKFGTTILALAAAIGILALTAKLLSTISWGGLFKALIGIGVFSAIVFLLTALVSTGGHKIEKLGRTIFAISAAIALLAGVSVLLGLINIKNLAQGLIVVGILSGLMMGLMYCAQFAKGSTGPLIAMVLGITILATTLVVLAQIPWKNLIAPVISMTIVIGMLALLMNTVGAVGKFSLGPIIAITAALGIMGLALSGLAKNPWHDTLAAAVALGGLMAVMSMVILPSLAMMSGMAVQALIGAVALTALAIPLLAFVGVLAIMSNVQNAASNALALAALTTVLTVLLVPLSLIGGLIVPALIGMAGLTAMTIPLLAFIGVLALMNNVKNATENVTALTTLLNTLTRTMVILTLVGPFALIGIGALAALTSLIVGMGVLVTAVGALTEKFPAIQTFVDTGIGLLERLANGIGSIVGNLVDGFLTAATENLPSVGARLSEFMTNLTPFLNGIKMVDDGLLGKVASIAGAIGLLTAANLITQMSEFLTNGASFSRLGTELSMFMTNAMPFITGASMLNESMTNAVRSLADTILILTATNILDGITSWITGGSSFASFGSELASLGTSMNAFITNLGTFGEEQLNTVKCACSAIKTLASAADSIPGDGGLWTKIVGDNSLATFGGKLPGLGTNISKFVSNLGTFTDEQVTTVKCAGTAIKTLAEAANKIPNEGGLWAKICGDNSLATFGSKLPGLAKHIKSFVANLGTFGEDKIASVKAACNVIKQIAKLGKTDMSGLSGDLDKLGKTLDKFAGKLEDFCKSMSGVASSDIDSAIDKVKKIISLAKDLSGVKIDSLESFGKTLKKIAKDGVKGFTKELSNSDHVDKVKKAADKLTKAYIKAIKDKKSDVKDAFKAVASEGAKGAKSDSAYKGFKSAGKYMVEGFAKGITANDFKAEAAAKAMAKAAKLAAEKALGIESPSKEMMKDGMWTVLGFVKGIEKNILKVSNAGHRAGDVFLEGFDESMDINSPPGEIIDRIETVGDAADIGVDNAEDQVFGAGSDMGEDFVSGVNDSINDSENPFNAVAVAADASADDMYDAGYKSGSSYAQGLTDGYRGGSKENPFMPTTGELRDVKEELLEWRDKYLIPLTKDEITGTEIKSGALPDFFEDEIKLVFDGKYERVVDEDGNVSIKYTDATGDVRGLATNVLHYMGVQNKTEQAIQTVMLLIEEYYGKQEELLSDMSSETIGEAVGETSGSSGSSESGSSVYKDPNQAIFDKLEKDRRDGKASLFDELFTYKRLLESGDYAPGSDRYNEIAEHITATYKEIKQINQDYYDDLQSLEEEHQQNVKDNIKELTTAYDDALKDRADTIESTYGLFDSVAEKEKVKGDDLLKNLEGQVDALKDWDRDVSKLASGGILNDELVEELRAMGPNAAAEIEALSKMSASQLKRYNRTWEEKRKLSSDIAKEEMLYQNKMTQEELTKFEENLTKLSEMVDKDGKRVVDDATIDKLREAGSYEVAENMLLSKKLDESLTNLEKEYSESCEEIRKTWNESMGFTVEETTDQFSKMIEDLIYQAGEKNQWTETGADIIEGLNQGIINKSSTLYSTISKVLMEAVVAAKNTIDSHSPSRVFMELGQFMDMGLVVGLKNYAGRVVSATTNVGERAISSMSDVVSGAYALISSDMDMQPTIRPVLDLSNVRSGSRTIGELMGLGSSVGVNANVGAISSMMSNRRQNGTNNDVVSAINDLRGELGRTGNSYNINGISYNEGSDVAEAIETLVRAARIERRT